MRKRNFLNSINRGFLLSAAIVFGVLIFLILQGQADARLEPELKALAESFIADSDKVVTLPEEYQLFDEPILAVVAFNTISESSAVNNKFYSGNPSLRECSLFWLLNCVSTQTNNQTYITSLTTEIVQFNRFSVYKGKATLSFDVLCNGEALSVNGATTIGPTRGTDTLTFEKENGEWVITNYETVRFGALLNGMGGRSMAW